MIPMAWISFRFLNLTGGLTSGLIGSTSGIEGAFGQEGEAIMFFIGSIIGFFLICLFPTHWVLIYHTENWLLVLAVTLPWILSSAIVSFLFAKKPRDGLYSGIVIGLFCFFIMSIIYFVLVGILNQFGLNGAMIINAVSGGLTDMPYLLATFTATMEGGVIGGVFGALIGSLKYKPEGYTKKKKKSKKELDEMVEPTFDTFASVVSNGPSTDFCDNCGAKLIPGDEFCTNCGTKMRIPA